MSAVPPSSHPKVLADPQWREICAQLRATDDISFKLLGFVPLLTVAAITVVLLKSEAQFSLALVLSCFVGALSTLGFWIWERRNIQTCFWLRDRAAQLESAAFGPAYIGQFARFPDSPQGGGKTEGEKLVYSVTLVAWLLVPASTLCIASDLEVSRTLLVYAFGAIVVALLSWRQFAVVIDWSPSDVNPLGQTEPTQPVP
jgi:hypothetical protein